MATLEMIIESSENEISKNLDRIVSESQIVNNDGIADKKKSKVKKIKDKTLRGQKRKCTDKIEFNKKVKRKKKELSSVDLNKHTSNTVEETADSLISPDTTPEKSKTEKKNKQNNSHILELDSDQENIENKNIIIHEKNKFISAKKLKSRTNACRNALEILTKLGMDVLTLINMSLKILKSHNFLDNKHISNETLLKLIELALISIKANEDVDAKKGTSFSKIIASLYISPSPKPSKSKKTIMNQNNSVKSEGVVVEEALPSSDLKSVQEVIIEPEVVIIEEEDNNVMDLSEENNDKINSVEKSGKNFCITNYFKKVDRLMEDGQNSEKYSSLILRANVYSAHKGGRELSDVRRKLLEEEMENQTSEINYLIENTPKQIRKMSFKNKGGISCKKEEENKIETEISKKEDDLIEKRSNFIKEDVTGANSGFFMSKNKAKLFQFHDNRRPPYWGTWRSKSKTVTGRKPFGKDKLFNYDIDSDDEWEEEPGESLHGSDEEKEPEEDYEVDNDFFVPHGYLSDDENPEKENMSPKTKLSFLEEQFASELKQKTKKMTPVVFGTYWENQNSPTKDDRFQDLGLGKLQYVYWVTPPIQIEEEETEKNNDSVLELESTSQTKKTRNKTTFPDTEIPNLIKIIHGSPHNCDWLAKKFLEQRESEKIENGKLTKVCVLKKIKELANWQASPDKKMRWQVPKDVQMEFKTEIEPEKKPQKCYIWKFVKKGNKTTGLPSPIPEQPEISILEPECENL